VYNASPDFYRKINLNEELTQQLINKEDIVFFKSGIPSKYVDTSVDYSSFKDINEAYHSLVVSLARLVAASIDLVVESDNKIEHLYITGGFTRNKIFTKSISLLYPEKSVFTSKIDNATSLGAAMLMKPDDMTEVDLGLSKV
jgi:sugar (pentulose or hexulose) kinase